MADLIPVLVPLVNPNENESLLAQLCVTEGQQVKAGQLLAVFETTKSTFELLAERDGFVIGFAAAESALLKTGDRLCYLAGSREQALPVEKGEPKTSPQPGLPSDLRITQPALTLARELGIELENPSEGTVDH